MYERILVPWDGSALSESALSIALPLARRQGASIEIVHVHQPPDLVGLAPMYDTQLDAELRDSMRTKQQALAQRLSEESGVPVTAEFLDGDVLLALVDYAERTGPDLVVMTTHGRSGLSRLWLGSITDALVRKLHIPILVTRGESRDEVTFAARDGTSASGSATSVAEPTEDDPKLVSTKGSASAPMFPRVLVPLDGSMDAEAVFSSISALIMPDEATVALLRVITPSVATDSPLEPGGFAVPLYTLDLVNAEAEAGAYLGDVAESLRAVGVRATTHVVIHSNAASAILNFASESPFASGNLADLIALAPHERTTSDRLLLGSVADKVLRGATTPVLLHRSAHAVTNAERRAVGSDLRHDMSHHGRR